MILDSDLIIDYLNGRGSARLNQGVEEGQWLTTTISLFEVLRGTATARQASQMAHVFDLVPQLPLTPEAARVAARVDQELRSAGLRLDVADTLIAGIALAAGMPLFTRNRRHFDRVPGLVVEEL